MGPEGSNTHVTTRVMGTYGYAAPEYVSTGIFFSLKKKKKKSFSKLNFYKIKLNTIFQFFFGGYILKMMQVT